MEISYKQNKHVSYQYMLKEYILKYVYNTKSIGLVQVIDQHNAIKF